VAKGVSKSGNKGSRGASGAGTVNPFASKGGGRTSSGKSKSSSQVQARPMRQGQGTPRGK
jgi:hypothetical protein